MPGGLQALLKMKNLTQCTCLYVWVLQAAYFAIIMEIMMREIFNVVKNRTCTAVQVLFLSVENTRDG